MSGRTRSLTSIARAFTLGATIATSVRPSRPKRTRYASRINRSPAAGWQSHHRPTGSSQHRHVISPAIEARQLYKILEVPALGRVHGIYPLVDILLAESTPFSRSSTIIMITWSTNQGYRAWSNSHIAGADRHLHRSRTVQWLGGNTRFCIS